MTVDLSPERDDNAELRRDELPKKIREGLDSLHEGDEIDGHEFFASLEWEEAELARQRSA